MEDELAWVYLNRFGWFYLENGDELDWNQAMKAYDGGATVVFRAPQRDAQPVMISAENPIEDIEQHCRTMEPEWTRG